MWLAGRGAWFEIRPSAEYASTYRKMCECIRLYYALFDIHDHYKKNLRILKKDSRSGDPVEMLSEVFLHVGHSLPLYLRPRHG